MLAALTAGVAAAPAPALAHQFGPNANGARFLVDGTVYYASDEDNWDHHLWWNHFVVMQQQRYDDLTDLWTIELPHKQYDTVTDIIWFATASIAPNRGQYECRRVSSFGNKCVRAVVMFREDLTRNQHPEVARHLVCHELAHAYGFGHLTTLAGQEPSCMEVQWSDQPEFAYDISTHMISHINQQY